MEIYLIRHTTPAVERGICYGHSDIPLATTFEEERAVLRAKLPAAFDAVYSSPLQRCAMLAEKIAPGKVSYDPGLMELNFGEWEMKSWDTLSGPELDYWMNDYVFRSPPGGESYDELSKRTGGSLQGILESGHTSVAVVSHGGAIRSLIARMLDIPLATMFKLDLGYGRHCLVIKENKMFRLRYLNH